MNFKQEIEIPQVDNVPEIFPPSPPEIDTFDEQPIHPEEPEKIDK